MNRRIVAISWIASILLVSVFAGCSGEDLPDPTEPPVVPTHQIAGSVLPETVGGYTIMGSAPTAGQQSFTYSRDAEPLDIVSVTLDSSGDFGRTTLSEQQWYNGPTRCGILWKGDPQATPPAQQVACVTVLTDGVMVLVSGGNQTSDDLAVLAEAITETLA